MKTIVLSTLLLIAPFSVKAMPIEDINVGERVLELHLAKSIKTVVGFSVDGLVLLDDKQLYHPARLEPLILESHFGFNVGERVITTGVTGRQSIRTVRGFTQEGLVVFDGIQFWHPTRVAKILNFAPEIPERPAFLK